MVLLVLKEQIPNVLRLNSWESSINEQIASHLVHKYTS